MTIKERITAKLEAAFSPASLTVLDESHQHAGHAFHPGGVEPNGETHFRIKIVSAAFVGKSRIERHRMINTLLADELRGGVHALAIHAQSGDE